MAQSPVLHLDAGVASSLRLEDGRIREWNSLSEPTVAFTAPQEAARPTPGEPLNGRPTVAFDGDDFLEGPPVLREGDDSFTIIALWRPRRIAVQAIFEQADQGTGRRASLLQVHDAYGFNGQANDFHSAVPLAAHQWRLSTIIVTGSRRNNVIVIDNEQTPAIGTIDIKVQQTGAASSMLGRKIYGSEFLQGEIAEIRVFETALPPEPLLQQLHQIRTVWQLPFETSTDALASLDQLIPPAARMNEATMLANKPTPEQTEFFELHVRPLLAEHCYECHSARAEKLQAGLFVDSRAGLLAGGDSGPAVTPGQPDISLLIEAVRWESFEMPPSGKLSGQQQEVLRQWVEMGAPWPGESASPPPDHRESTAEPYDWEKWRTEHWAFRAIRQPAVPAVADQNWPASDLDRFILARLEQEGLTPAPAADPRTLIRRLWFDVIGLPPGPADVDQFIAEYHTDSAAAVASMVDQLLDSPHYGERWGRYWLDVAGYADSEGGVSADPIREVAWKYRDYVIRSLNDDKPYDRFLTEQLAGDELEDVEHLFRTHPEEVTPTMVDHLIATGFLRMGIDQTGSRTMNFVPERLGVVNDAMTVLGSGVMGLTLECARCHSHKYDPIPQRDYYRLKAVFQGAYDEHDWLTFQKRSLNIDTAQRTQQVASHNPALTTQLKKYANELKKAETQVQLVMLQQHYPEQSTADRDETIRALKIADNNRSLVQRNLVEMLQQVQVLPRDQHPPAVQAALQEVDRLQSEIDALERQLAPSLEIRALWDRGDPSPTYLLRRGEHDRPGQPVGPGVPSVLTDGRTPFHAEPPFPNGTPKTGRRLALAQWLTRPDHPLTARVIVNRVWHHHFGSGIVRSLENFGRKGDQPSHPELLDWLALRFVEDGWSLKALHRQIMNSAAYQRSSIISDQAEQIDAQNRLLSHMPLKRLDAEALRDSLLAVSGMLSERMGGP
ncbi:MAG: DUF1549 domain-containing protein, partial [Planctomycetaceae bacterium]|nr:DUF1549 domain-containing protein [Planctomycetaceae bacterium]